MRTIPEVWDNTSFPYKRWAGLVALLIAEVLTLSVRFDGQTIRSGRPWSGLTTRTGSVVGLGLAVGLATLLVAGPGCYRELRRNGKRLTHSTLQLPTILGNLLAFCAFYRLSVSIFDGNSLAHGWDWCLFVTWGIAGSAVLVLWTMAVVPPDLWVVLMRRNFVGFVVGPALGAAAYFAGLLAQDQWRPLSRATLVIVNGLLSLVFSDTTCIPDQVTVGTSSFQVEISAECSGYEGVGLIAVFISVALWMFRRDFAYPRALLLLPLAMALIWLANVFRIASLIAIGTWGYPEFAAGAFHSLAGLLLFVLIGLGLIVWARETRYFSTPQVQTEGRPAALDSAYLMPAMAIIATAMVTGTLAPGFDRYYAARVIVATFVFFVYRRSYAGLHLKWSWEAVAIGCAVFALWIAMERFGATASSGTPIRSGLQSLSQGWATAWLFFRVAGSVVTVPLAEELAFRGYLTRRLIATDFQSIPPGQMTWWSFLISSFLFGALEGHWFAGTLAGMAYALAYRRRGELSDAVLAHGVSNGLIAITVLTTGSWSLWS